MIAVGMISTFNQTMIAYVKCAHKCHQPCEWMTKCKSFIQSHSVKLYGWVTIMIVAIGLRSFCESTLKLNFKLLSVTLSLLWGYLLVLCVERVSPNAPSALFIALSILIFLSVSSLCLKLAQTKCPTVLTVIEILCVSHGKSDYRKGFLCEWEL